MRSIQTLCLALLLAACGPTKDSSDTGASATEAGPWVRDAQGRMLLHRGINLNNHAKYAEGNDPGLSSETWDLLGSQGFTFVRYLVFWSSIEPEPGRYDEAYLDRVDQWFDELDARGVAILVDMHQDLWGPGFPGGDGAPLWTCDDALYEGYEQGTWWWEGYLTSEVQACFDRFWQDEALQDAYAEAWARMAEVALRHPGVFGYDLMNEPFPGTFAPEPFEEELLPALYERVIARVRAVDDERCPVEGGPGEAPYCRAFFLEPSLAVSITGNPRLRFPADETLVYAPHFYPSYAELGSGWDGDLSPEDELLDAHIAHAQGQGIPVLLDEYGIFSNLGNEAGYVHAVQDALEAVGGGTAYYAFDENALYGVLDEDGGPGPMMSAFHRPSLHAIPGRERRVEGLADGARVELRESRGVPIEAVVPVPCTDTFVEGAEVLARNATRWTLLPQEDTEGHALVTIRGCTSD
jgi:endoglycosylceramidase